MPRIRVLIADDHAILRSGLKLLLGGQSDMEVVGEAADGPATVRSAKAVAPDVVLLDLSMPGARSTQTIEQLVRLEPSPACSCSRCTTIRRTCRPRSWPARPATSSRRRPMSSC